MIKEELFKIILKYKFPSGLPLLPNTTGGGILKEVYPEEYKLAQAILDARFVRLDDVEIDEEKLAIGVHNYMNKVCGNISEFNSRELLTEVYQIEGILRVKGGGCHE